MSPEYPFSEQLEDIFYDYKKNQDSAAFIDAFHDVLSDAKDDHSNTWGVWTYVFETKNIEFLQCLKKAYQISPQFDKLFELKSVCRAYSNSTPFDMTKKTDGGSRLEMGTKQDLFYSLVDSYLTDETKKIEIGKPKQNALNLIINIADNKFVKLNGISKTDIDKNRLETMAQSAINKHNKNSQGENPLFLEQRVFESFRKLQFICRIFAQMPHAPLLDLFLKQGRTICLQPLTDCDIDGAYLPKSGVIILSDITLAKLHQGLVRHADECLKFSQTPVFQNIAKNYFNQSEKQMMLPFDNEFSYTLSPTDLKIAEYTRHHTFYTQKNERAAFARTLPVIVARLLYESSYDHSGMRSALINVIDTYAQAFVKKNQVILRSIQRQLQNPSMQIKASDLFAIASNGTRITKIANHKSMDAPAVCDGKRQRG